MSGRRGRHGAVIVCCATFALSVPWLSAAGAAQDSSSVDPPAAVDVSPPAGTDSAGDKARARALVSTLVLTFLLFLAFLLGSYVMVRYGRMVWRRPEAPGSSEYVDGWGSYRLSDEQVDRFCEDAEAGGSPDNDEPPPQ